MIFEKGYARTDLACESAAAVPAFAKAAREYDRDGFSFAELVVGEKDEAAIGRRRGRYVTAFAGRMNEFDDDESERFARSLGAELRAFVCSELREERESLGGASILVCGLGNRSVTPDALGPRTVDLLAVTRHLPPSPRFARLSAIAPGTLGQTGIEAAEQLAGAVAETRPDAVVAVDALASRSTERLAATVQLCSAGISPGSGVGSARWEISRETLGVPVIAVGVPTVVDCATLVSDALEAAGMTSPDGELVRVLDEGRSMFVSPRECDIITEDCAAIIAAAIEYACALRE